MPLTAAEREERIARYNGGRCGCATRSPSSPTTPEVASRAGAVVRPRGGRHADSRPTPTRASASSSPRTRDHGRDQTMGPTSPAALGPALHTIEAANTVVLLRTLSEEAWLRQGRHTQSGPYSAEDWLRSYSDHLETHARQIERNLAAWEQAAQR